jgi:cold shock CspA family protein
MTTGIISQLVKDRGFGFIKSSSGHELFFHRSQVRGIDFDLLTQGQGAVFNVALSTKGLQAIDVKPLQSIPTDGIDNSQLGKEVVLVERKASRLEKPGSRLTRSVEPAREKVAV